MPFTHAEDGMGEFDRSIRLRRCRDTLSTLGRYVSPSGFRAGGTGTPATMTLVESAILHRQRACRLIDRGLVHHPCRLDSYEWAREKCVLRMLEPTVKWLPLHLQSLIDTTRHVAVEQAGSYGIWGRMRAASFHAWTNDLIEALQQYRRACEALRDS